MSHFAVMVITSQQPTSEILSEALMPFHEFECTGIDRYIESQSRLEELKAEWQNDTVSRYVHRETGEIRQVDDELFKRAPETKEREEILKSYGGKVPGYSTRGRTNDGELRYACKNGYVWVYAPDENWEMKDVPILKIMTFKEFVCDYHEIPAITSHFAEIIKKRHENGLPTWNDGDQVKGIPEQVKYGWAEIDDKGEVVEVINRTNPNRHWDWYVVGGRWSNYLLTKSGKRVDSCQFKDLDFESERKAISEAAGERYDEMSKIAGDQPRNWRSWKDVVEDKSFETMEARRNFYNGQPQIIAIKANDPKHLFHPFSGVKMDDLLMTREEYVELNSKDVFRTYNVLDNTLETDDVTDKWIGGEMGWFGCGSQDDDWNSVFEAKLKSINPDHYVTIVDCHI